MRAFLYARNQMLKYLAACLFRHVLLIERLPNYHTQATKQLTAVNIGNSVKLTEFAHAGHNPAMQAIQVRHLGDDGHSYLTVTH